MKKRTLIAAALLLAAALPAGASGFAERFSLRLSPGGILPLGGRFSDTYKLGKVTGLGYGLDAALRYKVNDYVYLDAAYAYNWMGIKRSYQPTAYKVEDETPAFHCAMITLNGTVFLSTGYAIAPYVTLGLGLYPWRFTSKAFGGETWPAPSKPQNEFAATDFGLNGGIGAETYLVSRFRVFAEFRYHYVFARDVAKFGTDDWNQQDFVALKIGITYSFGHK